MSKRRSNGVGRRRGKLVRTQLPSGRIVIEPAPGTLLAQVLDIIRQEPGSTTVEVREELAGTYSPTQVQQALTHLHGRGLLRRSGKPLSFSWFALTYPDEKEANP